MVQTFDSWNGLDYFDIADEVMLLTCTKTYSNGEILALMVHMLEYIACLQQPLLTSIKLSYRENNEGNPFPK